MYDYVTMKNSKNVLYSIYVLEASRHTYRLLTNYFICPALIIRLGFIKLFLFVRIFWFNRQLVNTYKILNATFFSILEYQIIIQSCSSIKTYSN